MTTRSITGQYEFVHSSGIGLDYFTSRIDRLILQSDNRFILIVQNRSRLSQAARSIASGQQPTVNVSETRREGNYTYQGQELSLFFDDGGFEPGKISWNGEGIQLGPNYFNKVADSTFLPPTHRIQKDMDDIAKGLKIASTLGGIAVKAVKSFQHTVQATPESPPAPSSPPSSQTPPASSPEPAEQAQASQEVLFCDQCGARCRPGKRFCSQCGARLP